MRNEKGIRFDLMNEEDAILYLKKRNNYMRTAAYRKNYPKHIFGNNKGKYIQLDFQNLTTLSALDKEFREKLLQMSIDVEHAIQVHLLQELEDNDEEDGYQIVEDFLRDNPYIRENLVRTSGGVYTKGLFEKYFTVEIVTTDEGYPKKKITEIDCPVWVLLELLTFGDLLKFFEYYRNKYPHPNTIPKGILNMVKSMRNACAHNNCLFVNFAPSDGTRPPKYISDYASHVLGMSKDDRSKKLSNRPLLEMTGLFYVYDQLVSSEAKERMKNTWDQLSHKMIEPSLGQFENNLLVVSSLRFILNLIQHIH
ncbi:Abortive infection bacteriophage resistance protein [Selenomonas sp. GACV-9]|nr:Abortive infection bacteriophage resistance protein [Selenomonas ruminantium]